MGRRIADVALSRGVTDERVLAALATVDRRQFVPLHLIDEAWRDEPLPIGGGQTTSQPSLIGRMIAAAELGPSDRVLEIGTGCGYQTALLACVAGEVVSIERDAGLAERARDNLAAAGVDATVYTGDGTRLPAALGAFAAIIVSAATPRLPQSWTTALEQDGRLVAPVGGPGAQVVAVWRRRGAQLVDRTDLVEVRFVPLIGQDEPPVAGRQAQRS